MINNTIKSSVAIIHEYFTYLFFFALALPNKFLPLTIVLWSSSWLVWRIVNYKERYPLNRNTKIGAVLFLFFTLFHFSSLFWANDSSLASSEIEKKLSFVLFSLVALGGAYPYLSYRRIVVAFFAGSLFSLIVFSVFFIFDFYSDSALKYQLDILSLQAYINDYKHPAYLSLNLVLSFFLYLTVVKQTVVNRFFIALAYVLFVAFVFVSGSRAGFLSFALFSIGLLFFVLHNKWGSNRTFLVVLPFVIIFSLAVSNNNKFHNVFDSSELVDVRAPRKVLWNCAADMIFSRPLLGYGIGSSKVDFVQYCKEHGINNAEHRQLNVHNQYLELIMESGLISLFILFLSIFYLLRGLSRKTRRRGVILISIIGFSFLFESMLLRIAGLSTFVAMLLLVLNGFDKDSKELKGHKTLNALIGCVLFLFLFILSLLWHSFSLGFDSTRPVTYASKMYSVVMSDDLFVPLPQEVSGIDIESCKFDSSTVASLWSGNAYSLNCVESKQLNEDECLYFSVYCYVPEDFNGSWVRASIESAKGLNIAKDYYDLNHKGSWQKLSVIVDDEIGKMSAYLYFCKENCNSFKDLKGYVLFAYPQYIISEK